MTRIGTILCPTDFSTQAGYAFDLACSLARDHGARMIVLYVEAPITVAAAEYPLIPPLPATVGEALHKQLESIRPSDSSIPVEHRFCEGDPAHEIVRVATEAKADLIVMGTHGRSGLGRLVMGSVAEHVLRKAQCPVLTVKQPVAAKEPATTRERTMVVFG